MQVVLDDTANAESDEDSGGGDSSTASNASMFSSVSTVSSRSIPRSLHLGNLSLSDPRATASMPKVASAAFAPYYSHSPDHTWDGTECYRVIQQWCISAGLVGIKDGLAMDSNRPNVALNCDLGGWYDHGYRKGAPIMDFAAAAAQVDGTGVTLRVPIYTIRRLQHSALQMATLLQTSTSL